MERPPWPNRWDLAAWLTAAVLLGGSRFLADPLIEYTAWLVVFTIWMAWFVYYGVRWLYRSPSI